MVARHDHAWISFFMAAWSLGGALRQWPVGKASDTGGGKQEGDAEQQRLARADRSEGGAILWRMVAREDHGLPAHGAR